MSLLNIELQHKSNNLIFINIGQDICEFNKKIHV